MVNQVKGSSSDHIAALLHAFVVFVLSEPMLNIMNA